MQAEQKLEILKELLSDWQAGTLSELSAMIVVGMPVDPLEVTPSAMKCAVEWLETQHPKLFESEDD